MCVCLSFVCICVVFSFQQKCRVINSSIGIKLGITRQSAFLLGMTRQLGILLRFFCIARKMPRYNGHSEKSLFFQVVLVPGTCTCTSSRVPVLVLLVLAS